MKQAFDDGRDEAMDFLAAFGEYQVALFVGVVDIAGLARERTQREHRPLARAGKSLDQLARLLLGHRDYEIGLLEHLGMPLEVGGSSLVADVDADFAQRHPGVERDQRAVAGVRRDAGRGNRYLMLEVERVEFAPQDMLGHHAARGVGGANEQDGTKARLTRSRAFRFLLSRQKSTRPRPSPRPCFLSWSRPWRALPLVCRPVPPAPTSSPSSRPWSRCAIRASATRCPCRRGKLRRERLWHRRSTATRPAAPRERA